MEGGLKSPAVCAVHSCSPAAAGVCVWVGGCARESAREREKKEGRARKLYIYMCPHTSAYICVLILVRSSRMYACCGRCVGESEREGGGTGERERGERGGRDRKREQERARGVKKKVCVCLCVCVCV